MKILIAPDSYKGSLTAAGACEIMQRAILDVRDDCTVVKKPMADGGEGTLDTFLAAMSGTRIPIDCNGANGKKLETSYGLLNKTTAFIECANIVGLTQIPLSRRNPDKTTSYGIGEAINHALDNGCTKLVIGLGGSATNDGGVGMMQALGMQAFDNAGTELGPFGCDLLQVDKLRFAKLDQRIASTNITIASDVDNPLCGMHGATVVYGPQKGATSSQVEQYDQALKRYADMVESGLNLKCQKQAGAGAAGGLGFALLCLGAKMQKGAQWIANAVDLQRNMQDVDLIITGEGQSDKQTLFGKAPGFIAELAAGSHIPVILISGSLEDEEALLQNFTACFSMINKPMTLTACMDEAESLLYKQTKQVMRIWNASQASRR